MTGDKFGRTANPRHKNRSSNPSLVADHSSLPIQSLSGWGGVFNLRSPRRGGVKSPVAIPFRVGWGFQPRDVERFEVRAKGRNPFQGGVGFSTGVGLAYLRREKFVSQSLSGWGGDNGSDG